MIYRISAIVLTLALTACGGGDRYPLGDSVHGRAAERKLDPIGDPGNVAASDIAYARMVRDEGAGAALDRFAAPGAVLHAAGGPADAARLLTSESAEMRIARRGPRRVWSSCDGSLAVSTGRFARADGLVGNYTTVWELQRDGDYEWTYELREIDSPQPPPPAPGIAPDDDTIVVTELNSIEGRVADCATADLPPRTIALPGDAVRSGGGMSRDAMLAWNWFHQADGSRRVDVAWLRQGEWQTAHEYVALPAAEE